MDKTDISGVEFLPNDIFVKIIVDTLDPDDFYEFRNTYTKQFRLKYVKNEDKINKLYLEKYKVNYTDPNNFIYVSNGIKINSCKTIFGYWNWRRLIELYCIHFRKGVIHCSDMEITSFPIYPNMIKFFGDNNNLKDFPSQPKMEIFIGHHNKLTTFETQPKMTYFEGNSNLIHTFHIQPNMIYFYGIKNKITVLPSQPKLNTFYGDNIRHIHPQPRIQFLTINGIILQDGKICQNIKKRIKY